MIVTRLAEFFPMLPREIVGLVQKHRDRSVGPIDIAHFRFPDAPDAGRARRKDGAIAVDSYAQSVAPDDIACLQYTGGTTGVS